MSQCRLRSSERVFKIVQNLDSPPTLGEIDFLLKEAYVEELTRANKTDKHRARFLTRMSAELRSRLESENITVISSQVVRLSF